MPIEWSEEVLEETPSRATRFLSGVGALPEVRTLLEGAGMTDADIDEGRTLLLACLAAPSAPAAQTDTDSARRQRAAVAELDAWDEPNFARYEAALARRFPAVGEALFHDLTASSGAAAVQGVATLLARVDGLEHAASGGRDKRASDAVVTAASAYANVPAADCKAALGLLTQRGLDRATRDHLAALVKTALGPTESLEQAPAADAARRAKRRDAQRALKGWYEEWTSTARAVVKKRQHLIRMGLAKRKSPTRDAADDVPDA